MQVDDLPFGLREVTITPLDEDGRVIGPATTTRVKDFRLTDFRFTEVEVFGEEEMGRILKVMSGGEMSWNFDTIIDKDMMVVLGLLCRCCYGSLQGLRRCRRCVARP